MKYKYEVIGMIILPFILFYLHVLLLFSYQLGIDIGVFLRNFYEIVLTTKK